MKLFLCMAKTAKRPASLKNGILLLLGIGIAGIALFVIASGQSTDQRTKAKEDASLYLDWEFSTAKETPWVTDQSIPMGVGGGYLTFSPQQSTITLKETNPPVSIATGIRKVNVSLAVGTPKSNTVLGTTTDTSVDFVGENQFSQKAGYSQWCRNLPTWLSGHIPMWCRISPTPSPITNCSPRPACLDQNPRCMIAEPFLPWCPKDTSSQKTTQTGTISKRNINNQTQYILRVSQEQTPTSFGSGQSEVYRNFNQGVFTEYELINPPLAKGKDVTQFNFDSYVGKKVTVSGTIQKPTTQQNGPELLQIVVSSITLIPTTTCIPRPACLSANPPCRIAERNDYCPPTSPTPPPAKGQCNARCQTDKDCGNNLLCYQPPMPACPTGMMCAQVMPASVCRNRENPTDVSCGNTKQQQFSIQLTFNDDTLGITRQYPLTVSGIADGAFHEYSFLLPSLGDLSIRSMQFLFSGVPVGQPIRVDWVRLYGPVITPPTTPIATCMPRPACLDAAVPCKLAEPASGWCPKPTPPGQCGLKCNTDSDCGGTLICYQPPMPPCLNGRMCAQVMPPKVCRSKANPTDAGCSGIVCSPRPACLDQRPPCKIESFVRFCDPTPTPKCTPIPTTVCANMSSTTCQNYLEQQSNAGVVFCGMLRK